VCHLGVAGILQAKTKELKNSLNQEFRLIHELCLFVLNVSQRAELIRATLSTLHAYLSWVPVGYIFESNIVEMLLRLFPQPPFRNIALQCLTEVCIICSCEIYGVFHGVALSIEDEKSKN
jgi:exportin-1